MLPGTEGAGIPYWSPDSLSVAFNSGNTLKRVSLTGGDPLTLYELLGQGVGVGT
jgi:hypothetical protein